MPGFNLYTSNRSEYLVDALAEIINEPLKNPFAPETIIIQNRGMERWLSMQLSVRLGVWANSHYPFPNAFVHDLFGRVMPENPNQYQFDKDLLVWKIMQLLPEQLQHPAFLPLKRYLQNQEPLKVYLLSKKIADQFDQYTLYRPEMVNLWQHGSDNHWQAELWRHLFPPNQYHRALLKELCIEKLQKSSFSTILPERISVFGISTLAPYYVDILQAISSHITINIFVLNPSAEYWDDILSEKEIRHYLKRQRCSKKRRNTAEELHLFQGNSLLASLGGYGRDFLARLHESTVEEFSFPVDPGEQNLLTVIQSDMLHLKERGDEACPPKTITPDDCSVQIHSCHSPMREVEVLYDSLLALFQKTPDLKPSDVVVMSPDIEAYAACISAVFGAPENKNLRIPYSLSDRTAHAEGSITSAFLSLLELPGSRFTVSSILDLLDTTEISHAFQIREDERHLVRTWVRNSGIRWGLDEAMKEQHDLPAFPEHTWKSGLERLLLGYALPSENKGTFADIAGYDHIEGAQGITLGNLLNFFHTLVRFSSTLEQDYTLSEWSELLLSLLCTFFEENQQDQQELLIIRSIVLHLQEIERQSDLSTKVSFQIVKAFIESKLQEQRATSGFITGSVTFCAMLPMRSIPFKVVCLIGFNDDAFPRKGSSNSWNLIAQHPRRGDRSIQHEDRYLFLEALLSARNTLYISYVGQDAHGNGNKRPSVLVEELLDYIEKGFILEDGEPEDRIGTRDSDDSRIDSEDNNSAIVSVSNKLEPNDLNQITAIDYTSIRDHICIRHRLQAFSEAYFSPDSKLFSYSQENVAAAVELRNQTRSGTQFFCGLLKEPPEEFKTIQINDLIRFFRNTSSFILRQRLGVSFHTTLEQISNDEPFGLQGLEAYQVSELLAGNILDGLPYEQSYSLFKSSGMLPHGVIGEIIFKKLVTGVTQFVNKIQEFSISMKLENLVLDSTVGDFHLSGTIDHIYKESLIHYRYAKAKPSDYLQLWIKHLLLNSFKGTEHPRTSLLIAQDSIWRLDEIDDAEEQLRKLLTHFWNGLRFPLPFFPASSWAYAETVLKGKPVETALSAAEKRWYGDYFNPAMAEGDDPYHKTCYQSRDPLSEEFRAISVDICEPILQHIKKLENQI